MKYSYKYYNVIFTEYTLEFLTVVNDSRERPSVVAVTTRSERLINPVD